MDNKKFFSKYKKLFKTNKAVDYFLEEYQDKLPLWQEILKYYWPKTGKTIAKINRTDLADRVHSEYTRLWWAFPDTWKCQCVTCWIWLPWEEMQEWHYRTRGHYPTRYNNDNTHPQCYKCNVVLNWNYRNYHIYMVNMYWEKEEERLRTNNETSDYNQERYEQHILERYQFITDKKEIIKKYKKSLEIDE